MSEEHLDDLDQIFDDPELTQLARFMSLREAPDPPLDPSFRMALRRDLMHVAWEMAERPSGWWRRLLSPVPIAWASGAVGVALVATVAIGYVESQVSGPSVRYAGFHSAQQPIVLNFSQPMDHTSVENAISISPATLVQYQWNGNQLTIKPVSGNLAPNTQYQVKINSAKTTDDKQVSTVVRFVTATPQPAASPTPSPTPSVTISQEAALGEYGGPALAWADGGRTLYFAGGSDGLVKASPGGSATPVGLIQNADEAHIAPDQSHVALVSHGQLTIGALDGSGTSRVVASSGVLAAEWESPPPANSQTLPTPQPSSRPTLGPRPAQPIVSSPPPSPSPVQRLVYVRGSNVEVVSGDSGSSQHLTSLANPPISAWLSPMGDRLLYSTADQHLYLVDLVAGQETPLDVTPTTLVWSPAGDMIAYSTSDGVYVSDPAGQTRARLAALADMSFSVSDTLELAWSSQGDILVDNGAALWTLRPDRPSPIEVEAAQFSAVTWSPDGSAIAFHRSGQVWTANVATGGRAAFLQAGAAVVARFMAARVAGDQSPAQAFLDSAGQSAYKGDGTRLVIDGDPKLTRYYTILAEATGPDSIAIRIRLVLAHDDVEVRQRDEDLSLALDPEGHLLVHGATQGPESDIGKGPSVVSVNVEGGQIRIGFDADLRPETLDNAITLTDASGQAVTVQTTYADRAAMVIVPAGLAEGGSYTLTIGTGIRDVSDLPPPNPYNLQIFKP